MKRIIAVLAAFLALLVFTGCGNKSADSISGLISNYSNNFESSPVPQSVVEAMADLIENYSGGVKIPVNRIKRKKDLPPNTNPTVPSESETPATQPATPQVTTKQPETTAPVTESKKKPGKTPSRNKSIPHDICSNLKQAKENELYYLKKVTPRFSITINSKKNYSKELGKYIFPYFNDNYVVDCMYLMRNTMYYSLGYSQVKYDFKIDYGISPDKVRANKKKTYAELKKANKKLNLGGLSDYKKVKRINDYLCDTIEYSKSTPFTYDDYTVYGAICKGVCVCEGYAKAAKYLLDKNGVESYYVVGDTSGGPHAWNLVKVDGKWYHLDTTWNDTGNDRNEFFLVTDSFMSISRTWDISKYPASAKKAYGK